MPELFSIVAKPQSPEPLQLIPRAELVARREAAVRRMLVLIDDILIMQWK